MIILSLGALLVSALVSALLLKRSAENLADDPKATLQAAALSSLFIGLAALAELLLNQGGTDLQTLQRILSNLAYYAALPLLASAMLVCARNDHWSRPAWGRWLIGLFALFELLRRMEYGELYTQVIAVAVSAAILVSALITRHKLLRGITLFAGLNMAIALLLTGPGALSPDYSNPTLYPLLLAGAIPLTAIAIKQTVLLKYKKA